MIQWAWVCKNRRESEQTHNCRHKLCVYIYIYIPTNWFESKECEWIESKTTNSTQVCSVVIIDLFYKETSGCDIHK